MTGRADRLPGSGRLCPRRPHAEPEHLQAGTRGVAAPLTAQQLLLFSLEHDLGTFLSFPCGQRHVFGATQKPCLLDSLVCHMKHSGGGSLSGASPGLSLESVEESWTELLDRAGRCAETRFARRALLRLLLLFPFKIPWLPSGWHVFPFILQLSGLSAALGLLKSSD